ncbi:MAG: cytochrome c4 [Zoogloeaceae bacterium]|nr:cytochrome c4 [Zoogloeaceae bacterium]MCK6383134.1 cytochrome c4 [Rhodocyclaceae bacterium]
MNCILRVLILSAALAASGQAAAAGNAANGQAKAAVCGACHGADGNSPNPEWPSLAGQVPEYIVKQLHDFKAGRRSNETMGPMAQPLAREDIEDLAAYFSSQQPKAGEAKTELRAKGEQVYLKGKHRPAVTACIGCHGPQGQGNREWGKNLAAPPAVLAPALGGQQAAYVAKQLQDYKKKARSNDVGRVMRDISSRLSEEDILAVAEYITSLKR